MKIPVELLLGIIFVISLIIAWDDGRLRGENKCLRENGHTYKNWLEDIAATRADIEVRLSNLRTAQTRLDENITAAINDAEAAIDRQREIIGDLRNDNYDKNQPCKKQGRE